MPKLTKEEIRDRLKVDNVYIGEARTAFFGAVPERKFRYVIYIWLFGDRVTTRTVDIEKLEEDGTYTPKFDSVSVAATEKVQLPQTPSLTDPIIALEGGTRLYGKVSGNSLTASVAYFDSEI